MGEIRIVGPGKTRGYPYTVCKKVPSQYDLCVGGMLNLSSVTQC